MTRRGLYPLFGCIFSSCLLNVNAIVVRGSITWNQLCPDLTNLLPQTSVTLDGGLYKAMVRESGEFVFHDVAPGSYLLDVQARNHHFDQLRVDVLAAPVPTPSDSTPSSSFLPSEPAAPSNIIQVRPLPPGTPFSPSPPNPALEYPITLVPRGTKNFFIPRDSFDIVSMFKNPMMLMMLVAGGMIFILPKAMENLDPELVKDMAERQDRMAKMQGKIQGGDIAGITGFIDAARGTKAPSAQAPQTPSVNAKKGGSKKRR